MMNGSLLKGLRVATAGMIAENYRTLVTAQNLGNASTKADTPGGMPYRRKVVVLKNELDKKNGIELVRVKKVQFDKTPFKKVFSPGEPGADAAGYVLEPNVQPILEMADMREAARSHEASTKAFEKILQMLQNTIGLMKNV